MELTEPRWCLHPGTDLTAMHCGINALFSLFNISFFFSQSIELEDVSEADSRGKVSAPTSPLDLDEPKSPKIPEFPLSLLQSQQKCDVYPDLHKIIQVRLRANVVGGVETTFLKHSCHTNDISYSFCLTGQVHGNWCSVFQDCTVQSTLFLLLPSIFQKGGASWKYFI